jgi:hypothetical protein
MTESHRNLGVTSLKEQPTQRGFQSIKLGMSKDDVVKIVGVPDETRQVPFGGQTLTAWVYRTESKPIRLWFDVDGKLRLKN